MKIAIFATFLLMVFWTVSSFTIMNDNDDGDDQEPKVALHGDFGDGELKKLKALENFKFKFKIILKLFKAFTFELKKF